jgi:hypothetical protein
MNTLKTNQRKRKLFKKNKKIHIFLQYLNSKTIKGCLMDTTTVPADHNIDDNTPELNVSAADDSGKNLEVSTGNAPELNVSAADDSGKNLEVSTGNAPELNVSAADDSGKNLEVSTGDAPELNVSAADDSGKNLEVSTGNHDLSDSIDNLKATFFDWLRVKREVFNAKAAKASEHLKGKKSGQICGNYRSCNTNFII